MSAVFFLVFLFLDTQNNHQLSWILKIFANIENLKISKHWGCALSHIPFNYLFNSSKHKYINKICYVSDIGHMSNIIGDQNFNLTEYDLTIDEFSSFCGLFEANYLAHLTKHTDIELRQLRYPPTQATYGYEQHERMLFGLARLRSHYTCLKLNVTSPYIQYEIDSLNMFYLIFHKNLQRLDFDIRQNMEFDLRARPWGIHTGLSSLSSSSSYNYDDENDGDNIEKNNENDKNIQNSSNARLILSHRIKEASIKREKMSRKKIITIENCLFKIELIETIKFNLEKILNNNNCNKNNSNSDTDATRATTIFDELTIQQLENVQKNTSQTPNIDKMISRIKLKSRLPKIKHLSFTLDIGSKDCTFGNKENEYHSLEGLTRFFQNYVLLQLFNIPSTLKTIELEVCLSNSDIVELCRALKSKEKRNSSNEDGLGILPGLVCPTQQIDKKKSVEVCVERFNAIKTAIINTILMTERGFGSGTNIDKNKMVTVSNCNSGGDGDYNYDYCERVQMNNLENIGVCLSVMETNFEIACDIIENIFLHCFRDLLISKQSLKLLKSLSFVIDYRWGKSKSGNMFWGSLSHKVCNYVKKEPATNVIVVNGCKRDENVEIIKSGVVKACKVIENVFQEFKKEATRLEGNSRISDSFTEFSFVQKFCFVLPKMFVDV